MILIKTRHEEKHNKREIERKEGENKRCWGLGMGSRERQRGRKEKTKGVGGWG